MISTSCDSSIIELASTAVSGDGVTTDNSAGFSASMAGGYSIIEFACSKQNISVFYSHPAYDNHRWILDEYVWQKHQ